MRYDNSPTLLIGLSIAFLVISGLFVLFSAHMESQTYNKLTGANTTWWDALWVELRVQNDTRP